MDENKLRQVSSRNLWMSLALLVAVGGWLSIVAIEPLFAGKRWIYWLIGSSAFGISTAGFIAVLYIDRRWPATKQ